ncbi:MAG TPA: class I SAM-dependent methyltransferase [Acidimicrobiales bacterium]|nr:class I SAM-dependent methyltransferase [Acidimicrobiales bacterium]
MSSADPDLTPEHVAELREALGQPGPPPPPPPPAPLSQRAKVAITALVGPIARRALDGIAVRVSERVAVRVETRTTGRVQELAALVASLQQQVTHLVPSIHALGILDSNIDLFASADTVLHEVRVNAVQLELLRAQLMTFERTLDDLGRAIAPDAGIEAASHRFAELRDQIQRLDRAVREMRRAGSPASHTSEVPEVLVAAGSTPVDFDYVGFERRFRGDPADIAMTLAERYVEMLADHAPVIDVGCGAGGLLAALREAGIDARGVDLDGGMVAEARAAGLDVVQSDGLSFLASLPDASVGAITAIHVIEHLEFADLCRFLDLAAAKLVPGGVLVCETPNPTALIVLGHSYILDPTHKWPLHPSLVTFLCERAGFADVEVRFHSPADFFAVPLLDESADAPPQAAVINDALRRLNSVLFGPQEYAVVATRG